MNFSDLTVRVGDLLVNCAFTREFVQYIREFWLFTRKFVQYTREFWLFTREFRAFTREFRPFTREFTLGWLLQ
ncbi:hypothetical protein [Peribacillus sp. AS_2]|uniref:hypothetical protein n=1 Tax=Peribacillus sp. AS_2 TaxID=2996755 RepID=UPI0022A7CEBE|nr:hypothetical protein [Peribacillus sp. AS_2]MCZ0871052.1 hypothetical protein [Peribacillus sp. AS_2]